MEVSPNNFWLGFLRGHLADREMRWGSVCNRSIVSGIPADELDKSRRQRAHLHALLPLFHCWWADSQHICPDCSRSIELLTSRNKTSGARRCLSFCEGQFVGP